MGCCSSKPENTSDHFVKKTLMPSNSKLQDTTTKNTENVSIQNSSLNHNKNENSNLNNELEQFDQHLQTNQPIQTKNDTYHPSLSPKELEMAEIAKENQNYILTNQPKIGISEYIDDEKHIKIDRILQNREKTHKNAWIYVNNCSSIQEAINCNQYNKNQGKDLKICILNFADAFKPGGGYLNGRSPQEETLCRQTLLYPTLINEESLQMYEKNKNIENYSIEHDSMIYSKDVEVIRDDSYEFLEDKFYVNIISAPAFDNRKKSDDDNNFIMERRIRKIIKLAAYENNDVLILGAFGCGVFRNDPYDISKIFRDVLINENLKDYFQSIWFPIYKSERNFNIFKRTFTRHKRKQ